MTLDFRPFNREDFPALRPWAVLNASGRVVRRFQFRRNAEWWIKQMEAV